MDKKKYRPGNTGMSELNEMIKPEETARQVYNIFRGSYNESGLIPPHWDDLPYYIQQAFIFVCKNRDCSVASE